MLQEYPENVFQIQEECEKRNVIEICISVKKIYISEALLQSQNKTYEYIHFLEYI